MHSSIIMSRTKLKGLPEEYICSICSDVVFDAKETRCCKQSMCLDCVNKLMNCPACNKPPPRAGTRQLHIYCTNRDQHNHIYQVAYPANPNNSTVVQILPEEVSGCNWRGEVIDDLQTHLDNHCPHATVTCRYSCGIEIIRYQKEFHESKACHKRPFACWFCGQEGTAEEIEHHASECKERPTTIACPNKCQAVVVREELEAHLEQCPLQEVLCEFQYTAGCEEMVLRKDYDSHIKDNALKHLSLLSQSFATQLATPERQVTPAETERQVTVMETERIATVQQISEEVVQKMNEKVTADIQSSMSKQITAIKREVDEKLKELYQKTADAKKELEKTTQKAQFLAQLHLETIDITIRTLPKGTMISAPFFISGYCMSVRVNHEQATLHLVLQQGKYDNSLVWPVEGEVVLILLHAKDSSKNKELKYFINKTPRPLESVEFRHAISYISNLPAYLHHHKYQLAVKSTQL